MKTLFILISLFFNTALSQDYEDYQNLFFLDRTPSARVDALGRAGVALHGNPSSSYYNPANIGTIENYMISFSQYSPYFDGDKSQLNYFAAAFPVLDLGTIALTYQLFDYGSSFKVTDSNANYIKTVDPYLSNIALTYSYPLEENFHVALTTNYFTDEGSETNTSLNFDLGVLYLMEMSNNSELSFAASLKNVFNQGVDYNYALLQVGDESNTIKNLKLPMQMRLGVAYENDALLDDFFEDTQTLGFIVHSEIQTLFNSDYYDAFRVGGEFTLFEALIIRTGYYFETADDYDAPESNKDYLEDFTYGFGLHLDFNKYFEMPFSIDIDYTNLERVFASKNPPFTELPKMDVFSLGLNWLMD